MKKIVFFMMLAVLGFGAFGCSDNENVEAPVGEVPVSVDIKIVDALGCDLLAPESENNVFGQIGVLVDGRECQVEFVPSAVNAGNALPANCVRKGTDGWLLSLTTMQSGYYDMSISLNIGEKEHQVRKINSKTEYVLLVDGESVSPNDVVTILH